MKKSYLKIMLESGRELNIECDRYKLINDVLKIYLDNKLIYMIPIAHIEAIKIGENSEERKRSTFIDEIFAITAKELDTQKEIKRCCIEGEKNAYNKN